MMDLYRYDPEKIKAAIKRGRQSDLRFACECADKIVSAAKNAKDEETLAEGFKIFRARKGFEEDPDPDTFQVHLYPLAGKDVSAPPKDKVMLGRFNPPNEPVLYLSTTREVALAEIRALSSDTCTVATFQTMRPVRIAKLLQLSTPLDVFLSENPSDEDREKWLLSQVAKFVSRRVQDDDRELHYRTCNLIASAFMESGFEGLAYRTSFWSPGWRDEKRPANEDHIFAANIVLFDPEAAAPKQSALFRIDWKRPYAEHQGGGTWSATAGQS